MSLIEIVDHDEVIYTILDKPPPEPPKTPRLESTSTSATLKASHRHKRPAVAASPSRQTTTKCNSKFADATSSRNVRNRYESKLERQLKDTKTPPRHRTFGYAETPLNPPTEFLKKGEGMTQPQKISDHKCYTTGLLPPIPKRPPPQKKVEKPYVNFRVINIKKAVKVKGKPVEPSDIKIDRKICCYDIMIERMESKRLTKGAESPKMVENDPEQHKNDKGLVDTRDGHIKKLKGSGEIPEYCLREDFGQMPAYLVKRNKRIWKENEKLRLAEENRESLCKLVSAEERQTLLNDLKKNWELMQKAFLQLPMLTDTIPKILRKSKMELELKELEKDIALVESNPYIYIYE